MGYKLEGLDAAIVPDGVVSYEVEEANRYTVCVRQVRMRRELPRS